MYNERIEKLIDAALTDGTLTEKEKQILFKNAEEQGIDLDEFEMVLDAKLFERNKANQNTQKSAPKSDKFGDVRKCPTCGALLQTFQTKCQECGYEFTNIGSVNSAKSLFDLLQAVELRKSERLSSHDKASQSRLDDLSKRHNSDGTLSKVLGGRSRQDTQNDEREHLIGELDNERRAIERQSTAERANIIKNFPVPNSKEDLLELLAMATSNAYDNDGVIGNEEEVWIQKVDQIYQKVIVCSTNDKAMLTQATNMVFSLMKRLPDSYKSFTNIPSEMKGKLEDQLRADKEVLHKKKMEILKKRGIPFLICIGVGIITLIISPHAQFLSFIAIAAFVAAYFLYKKYKKDMKDINLFK